MNDHLISLALLIDDPAAEQTWKLQAENYADQRLTPDTNMRLDLHVDSLEWINLSLAVRKEAGVDIDEEAIGRIETVRDLLEAASEATADGRPLAAAPLDDPESVLNKQQRRHLKPHGRITSLLPRGTFVVNRLLMRLVFRLEVNGEDQLPKEQMVIVPNHVSLLDLIAVAAALSPQQLSETYWGGWTGRLFANPLMRWFSRLGRVVPAEPEGSAMSSLALAAAVLDRGHNLV